MNLSETVAPGHMTLPKLDCLTGLTALNLSENCLFEVPQQLSKLKNLRFLDLSLNALLTVRHSVNPCFALVLWSEMSHTIATCYTHS